MRRSHVDGRLGATLSAGLAGMGLSGSGSGGGVIGARGLARGALLLTAFEKAVLRLWPAFCHIDAQRRRAASGAVGKGRRLQRSRGALPSYIGELYL